MSSIAYVTDENMLEYHRISRNRTILFWRLSSKKKFSDFHKGDLLFFYSRPYRGRRKGLIGYAHFDSTRRLSLKQMWKDYGEATGYGSYDLLSEAIDKAARGDIPKTMSCLYLTDVVFFLSPIYPEEIGLDIPINLESYCYLDRRDPRITVKILQLADERGIDLWSSDSSKSPEEIFEKDEIRHEMAVIHNVIGKESGTEKERLSCRKAALLQADKKGWELISGSRTDCVKIDRDTTYLGIPYAAQANDRDQRKRELIGRLAIYRMMAKQYQPDRKVVFEIISDKVPDDVKDLVEEFNNEQL